MLYRVTGSCGYTGSPAYGISLKHSRFHQFIRIRILGYLTVTQS